ncbi:MAG TPA: class I SAM-dependent methyltransferase [Chthoniobacterales bacterium]|jgi:ubiquinone/menaquinone biosynthesis C-methylase UbiE|nr:class I SAM-dependent methyltransferase [Chthoniobacterales bacterium]
MKPEEHEIMRAVEDRYWWYQALRQHVGNVIESSGANFSLLDAGCGSGGMLAALRQRFPKAELSGIDAFERGVQLTTERGLGVRLMVASVHELPFPDNSFDFVLSLDVWSHVGVDDALAAHETLRVLRPGGRLILNLAAFEFLKGAHDHATDVVRRYMRPEVRALLEGAGFDIERLTYWNLSLMPPIAMARWLSRRRIARDEARSDFRPLPALVNTALKGIAALELSASRHLSLPFGTSVLAVARKHG